MFFSKTEKIEVMLPFYYCEYIEEVEGFMLSIEAYGIVCEEMRYFHSSYQISRAKEGDFEDVVELLKNSTGKKIKLIVKVKKGKPKNFKIDLKSLAEIYNDDRFLRLSCLSAGIGTHSFKEIIETNSRYDEF